MQPRAFKRRLGVFLRRAAAVPSALSGQKGRQHSRRLQQPLYWQQRQQAQPQAAPPAATGLGGVQAIIGAVPLHFAGARQAQRIGALGHVGGKRLLNLAGQQGAVDDKAQLGVEQRRARVKVKGANKSALTIDGKSFGVQARA